MIVPRLTDYVQEAEARARELALTTPAGIEQAREVVSMNDALPTATAHAGHDAETTEALRLLEDAIVRIPKLGGAGAIYEKELIAVLKKARGALSSTRHLVVSAEQLDDMEATAFEHRGSPNGASLEVMCACGHVAVSRGQWLRHVIVVAVRTAGVAVEDE